MISSTRLFAASVFALVLIAMGAPAQAQPKACQADIEKFCAKVEKGQGRILKCLKEHNDELSTDCKTVLERRAKRAREGQARRQGRPAARRVCDADVQKFCKDSVGDREKLTDCLRKNQNSFSPECKEKVDQLLKAMDQKKPDGKAS